MRLLKKFLSTYLCFVPLSTQRRCTEGAHVSIVRGARDIELCESNKLSIIHVRQIFAISQMYNMRCI